MPEPIGLLSSLTIQVIDMDDACEFYSEVMGFKMTLRDGDRRAEFDTGTLTLVLAARDSLTPSVLREPVALNVKVIDVGRALEQSLWGGARLVEELKVHGLESRATVQDPSGRIINFYARSQS